MTYDEIYTKKEKKLSNPIKKKSKKFKQITSSKYKIKSIDINLGVENN